MLVNKVFKAVVQMSIDVTFQQFWVDASLAHCQLGRGLGKFFGMSGVGLDPADIHAELIRNSDLPRSDGKLVLVAMSDQHVVLVGAVAFDDAWRNDRGSVAVGMPVLDKVPNVANVHAGARNLPEPSVGRLAAGAGLARTTRLLQKLAPQTSLDLADDAGRPPLLGIQRTGTASDSFIGAFLLCGCRCLLPGTCCGNLEGRAFLDRLCNFLDLQSPPWRRGNRRRTEQDVTCRGRGLGEVDVVKAGHAVLKALGHAVEVDLGFRRGGVELQLIVTVVICAWRAVIHGGMRVGASVEEQGGI